ncbi:MAG: acyl carrier protein [Clostridia bacterium]|nr:acyl carrier protein [Clostridia bacterium]
MSEDLDSIFESVKEILTEQFGDDKTEITMDTDLFNDLDADSLDLADLISSIEDEFKVEASDEIISSITTVGNIVEYIAQLKHIS